MLQNCQKILNFFSVFIVFFFRAEMINNLVGSKVDDPWVCWIIKQTLIWTKNFKNLTSLKIFPD